MNRSSQTPITDELLSAYIDGLVTDEEKARIEAAVATDPGLAWELDTLRRTVELMRDLPPLPLPRSFVLREEQVADVLAERRQRAAATASLLVASAPAKPAAATLATQRRPAPRQTGSFWQGLLAFFNSGNLLLRNAAAVAALFLVIVWAMAPGGPTAMPMASPAPEAQFFAAASDAQPAAESEAAAEPAAEETIAQESAPAGVSESPPAEKAGPSASTSAAAVSEAPVAEAPVAQSAPPGAGQMEAAAGPNVRGIGPEGMRAGPEAAAGEGIGGGGDIGPMAMQGVPADAAVLEGPVAVTGVGDVPGEAQPESAAKLPPAEESAAPAPEESAADESASAEPAAAAAAVVSSADAETPKEMTAAEVTTEAAMAEARSAEQQADVATPWRTTQTLLAGLALLLTLLWLISLRTRPNG